MILREPSIELIIKNWYVSLRLLPHHVWKKQTQKKTSWNLHQDDRWSTQRNCYLLFSAFVCFIVKLPTTTNHFIDGRWSIQQRKCSLTSWQRLSIRAGSSSAWDSVPIHTHTYFSCVQISDNIAERFIMKHSGTVWAFYTACNVTMTRAPTHGCTSFREFRNVIRWQHTQKLIQSIESILHNRFQFHQIQQHVITLFLKFERHYSVFWQQEMLFDDNTLKIWTVLFDSVLHDSTTRHHTNFS